jgi:MFS family permease
MAIGCFAIDKKDSKQPKRAFLINFVMFTSFFSVYYTLVYRALPGVGFDEFLTIILQAVFLFTVVITILVVSHVNNNLGKKHITIFSLATIVSLPCLFVTTTFLYDLFLIILIGIFFGICQLSAYILFWKTTESLKRSRIAGLIGFMALICYYLLYFVSLSLLDYSGNIVLCLLLFAGTAIGSLFIIEKVDDNDLRKKAMYFPERRTILLYAAPWVLFTLLNVTLSKNITVITSAISSSSIYLVLFSSQIVGGVCGALIGGYFGDRLGRRLTLVFSVALYGVSMAFRGFTDNWVALLFSFIGEGLTWGIFLTLYSFVIWGDLSNTKNTGKTYAIGLMTFYVTAAVGRFNLFAGISVVNSTLISCILIFLAIIPIVLAPELLPSEAQENSKLKKYMSTVQKIANEEYLE